MPNQDRKQNIYIAFVLDLASGNWSDKCDPSGCAVPKSQKNDLSSVFCSTACPRFGPKLANRAATLTDSAFHRAVGSLIWERSQEKEFQETPTLRSDVSGL
jgi:phage gp46-like protein